MNRLRMTASLYEFTVLQDKLLQVSFMLHCLALDLSLARKHWTVCPGSWSMD